MTMDSGADKAVADCLCGAIRVEADLPSQWVAHCHCTRCQRAHGAAFVTWVGFKESQVRIIDAEGQLRWFQHPPTGADRGFCARCGTTLFFRSPRWAGELHITAVNFHTPLDRRPQAHVNFDTQVDWFEVHDALPKKPAVASD